MKARCFLIAIIILLAPGATVLAGTVFDITCPEAVDGAIAGQSDFTLDVWLDNTTPDVDNTGCSFSFKLYALSGIENIVHRDVDGELSTESVEYINEFETFFDMGVLTDENGWNGQLPDSVNFTTIGLMGLSPDSSSRPYIRFHLHADQDGILCLDSCANDANPDWDWLFMPELEPVLFGGPYCWTIGNPEIPPQVTCPNDTTLSCEQPYDPDYIGYAVAEDPIDPAPALYYFDDIEPGDCDGEQTVIRRWYAVNASNLYSDTCTQIISIVDTTAPVIDCEDEILVYWGDPTDPASIGVPVLTDNCSSLITSDYSDDVHSYGIIRTWQAVDDCGNTAERVQNIYYLVDSYPKTWYVSTSGDDGEPGTFEKPFETIQHGIDIAGPFDTIGVMNGTYTGPGNRNLDPLGKSIVIRSLEGPAAVVIDCQGSPTEHHRGFYIHNGEDDNTLITGFTIINGYSLAGGAIACENKSAPIIENCLIYGNDAAYFGGGLFCGKAGISYIDRDLLESHAGPWNHELTDSIPQPTIINCTFVANGGNDFGGGIFCDRAAPLVENSIIAFSGSGGAVAGFESRPDLRCCDIYGNTGGDWTGCIIGQENDFGNFAANPLFCEPETDNYAISLSSPCAVGNNRCGVLIGALEPGCRLCGDLDYDGLVNVLDLLYLINYKYNDGPAPDPFASGDFNVDGRINIIDVIYLIHYEYKNGPEPICPDGI